MAKKSGLGRGLDALFSENTADATGTATLRVSEIEPNRSQPRKHFDPSALEELCDSIREHGVLQPLVVRPTDGGGYQLVAGERRWRAARMAELTEVPVVIKEMTDAEAMEIALIENLQREDLDPIEEALGYKDLMDNLGMTQEDVAKRLGKSRPAIANALRLLSLPDNVKSMVSMGSISVGSARAMLSLPENMIDEAVRLTLGGATVREIEELARTSRKKDPSSPKKPAKKQRDRLYDEAELSLSQALGRPVKIVQKSRGGTLQIDFYGTDDLTALANSIVK